MNIVDYSDSGEGEPQLEQPLEQSDVCNFFPDDSSPSSSNNFWNSQLDGEIDCSTPDVAHMVTTDKDYTSLKRKRPLREAVVSKKKSICRYNNELPNGPIDGAKDHLFVFAPYVKKYSTCAQPMSVQKIVQGHSGSVNRVSWNSRYPHLLASCGMDRTVRVWNAFLSETRCQPTHSVTVSSPSLLAQFGKHTASVRVCCWVRPDEGQILTAGYDSTSRLWAPDSDSEVLTHHHLTPVTSITQPPWCSQVYLAGSSNLITAWDLRVKDRPVLSFVHHHPIGQVMDLVCLPQTQETTGLFVSCSDAVARDATDLAVMVWDYRTTSVLSGQIYQERFSCSRLACHPNKREFVAQTQGDYLALFSAVKPFKMNKTRRYEGHRVEGYSIGCSYRRDGRLIASGSACGRVYLYKSETGDLHCPPLCIEGSTSRANPIVEVSWHPQHLNILVAATWTGQLAVFVGVN